MNFYLTVGFGEDKRSVLGNFSGLCDSFMVVRKHHVPLMMDFALGTLAFVGLKELVTLVLGLGFLFYFTLRLRLFFNYSLYFLFGL